MSFTITNYDNASVNIEGDTEYVKVNKKAFHHLVSRVMNEASLIRSLRYELSVLNRVIAGRKKAAKELRSRLEGVKRLHYKRDTFCNECSQDWPCDTYLVACPSTKGQIR